MRFPIDLVFVDSNLRVIKVVHNMKPWRVGIPALTASHVVELSANNIFSESLTKGDQLHVGS